MLSPFEPTMARVASATAEAANGGASIVSFAEYTMVIGVDDEPVLLDRLGEIAAAQDVYLNLTYVAFPADDHDKGENVTVVADPLGEIVLRYVKRYPLGFGDFGETGAVVKGDGDLRVVETPFGTLSAVICRDLGSPRHVAEAADLDVDLMLNPSDDWPRSTGPLYDLRAVEYGFSIVRPVYNGYSYATDPHGRILYDLEVDPTEGGILYAEVPTSGVATAYGALKV